MALVTGDLVDSANVEYGYDFENFHDDLRRIFVEPPFFVVGNHDVRRHGLFDVGFPQFLGHSAKCAGLRIASQTLPG